MTSKKNNPVNSKPAFVNEKVIPVPASLEPLTGSVTVPIVLNPTQFNEFWIRFQEEEAKEKKRARKTPSTHSVLSTYYTRWPLVLSVDLLFDGTDVDLPEDPNQLIDQAIAAFVVAATQPCVLRASRLPLLDSASKKGTDA